MPTNKSLSRGSASTALFVTSAILGQPSVALAGTYTLPSQVKADQPYTYCIGQWPPGRLGGGCQGGQSWFDCDFQSRDGVAADTLWSNKHFKFTQGSGTQSPVDG